jgi:hypothetical protein
MLQSGVPEGNVMGYRLSGYSGLAATFSNP